MLFCNTNQSSSFQHLPNSVTELFCGHNKINSIKDLLYIPLQFECDIDIMPDDIYKYREIYGLNNINKNKQAIIIQKNCNNIGIMIY